VFALVLGVLAASAHAHAIIVAARPAANGVVPAGDLDVRLEFNSRIDRDRSRVTLTSPQHTETPVVLVDTRAANVLAGRASAMLAGPWTLHWQVLSTDGHITRGDLPFIVRPR
jgi:methionine-rich copper-binding protein CopC